ncbi:hypothetical protein EYF80_013892 [Liparis tanakae]|uniref:Uncharacterized protein n=1 Tax=Liparis tanakae TaxID=230148 RepID=A0A4Z2IF26_9TELE|nr:hypothetical protein EYF80_013892 [Liparis tanakae]
MHDQGRRKGRADHASSFPQMGCGLEWVRREDFASSWTHGARKVENAVSLTLLPRAEDFAGSWRHGESEGGRVLEPWETAISEVAFCNGRGGRPWGTQVALHLIHPSPSKARELLRPWREPHCLLGAVVLVGHARIIISVVNHLTALIVITLSLRVEEAIFPVHIVLIVVRTLVAIRCHRLLLPRTMNREVFFSMELRRFFLAMRLFLLPNPRNRRDVLFSFLLLFLRFWKPENFMNIVDMSLELKQLLRDTRQARGKASTRTERPVHPQSNRAPQPWCRNGPGLQSPQAPHPLSQPRSKMGTIYFTLEYAGGEGGDGDGIIVLLSARQVSSGSAVRGGKHDQKGRGCQPSVLRCGQPPADGR